MWPFGPPPQDTGNWVVGYGATILFVLLLILAVMFWLWGLRHAIRNPALPDVARITWIAVIVLLPVIGVVLYMLFRPRATTAGPMQRT